MMNSNRRRPVGVGVDVAAVGVVVVYLGGVVCLYALLVSRI